MQFAVSDILHDDLKPIDEMALNWIIDELFPSDVVYKANQKIKSISYRWPKCSFTEKLAFCDSLYEILFSSYFPKPKCVSFHQSHRSAAGLFYSQYWQIELIRDYLERAPFHDLIGVYLHESFHAFLHFLSLCLSPTIASPILWPPYKIIQITNQIKIDSVKPILFKIAKRNLLGMFDRGGISIDSYYINVEILVDNFAERLFKKLFPGITYERGYAKSENYINQRLSKSPPESAIKTW